jgi:hypothetical protein
MGHEQTSGTSHRGQLLTLSGPMQLMATEARHALTITSP